MVDGFSILAFIIFAGSYKAPIYILRGLYDFKLGKEANILITISYYNWDKLWRSGWGYCVVFLGKTLTGSH